MNKQKFYSSSHKTYYNILKKNPTHARLRSVFHVLYMLRLTKMSGTANYNKTCRGFRYVSKPQLVSPIYGSHFPCSYILDGQDPHQQQIYVPYDFRKSKHRQMLITDRIASSFKLQAIRQVLATQASWASLPSHANPTCLPTTNIISSRGCKTEPIISHAHDRLTAQKNPALTRLTRSDKTHHINDVTRASNPPKAHTPRSLHPKYEHEVRCKQASDRSPSAECPDPSFPRISLHHPMPTPVCASPRRHAGARPSLD